MRNTTCVLTFYSSSTWSKGNGTANHELKRRTKIIIISNREIMSILSPIVVVYWQIRFLTFLSVFKPFKNSRCILVVVIFVILVFLMLISKYFER